MGFEQIVPPIPDRKAEVEAMQKLEQSWLNQAYNRYYMNESLRQPKIAYSNMINKAYREFFFKIIVFNIALLPAAYFARRFFIRRGGLPVTFNPDNFNRVRPDREIRYWSWVKYVLPAHLFGATYLAYVTTDFQNMLDPYYQWVHKVPKMM